MLARPEKIRVLGAETRLVDTRAMKMGAKVPRSPKAGDVSFRMALVLRGVYRRRSRERVGRGGCEYCGCGSTGGKRKRWVAEGILNW